MRALRGLDLEARDAALDDDLRLGDVVPAHRDAQEGVRRTPAPGPHEDVGAPFVAHAVVEREQLVGDLLRCERVERLGLHVDDVGDLGHHPDAEGLFAVDQRLRGVDPAPVQGAVVLVVDDRADLQQVEDLLAPRGDVHVHGELHLHRAAHLLGTHREDVGDDLGQREGVVLEDVVERNDLAAPVEGTVRNAFVLAIPDRADVLRVAELGDLLQAQPLEVHRIVDRRAELLGAQAQGQDFGLRLAQRQLRGRGLEHLLRVAGREAQRAPSVDDQLAQPHGQVADAVRRLFVADRVVVDRACDARAGGQEDAVLLRAAHLLDDNGHLLLGDEVLRGGDVGPRRREVDRGVDALDRPQQQAQHLVLVVGVGDHVGGVDPGEGLVVRILELRRRTHGQRRMDGADVCLELLLQLQRDVRGHEFREDLLVGEVLREEELQSVLGDEFVEVARGDDHRAGDHDPHVAVLVVLAVLDEHRVHEGQAAGLSSERPFADAGEGHGVGVGLGVEARHHALTEQRAVVADQVHEHPAVLLDGGEVALVVLADRGREREEPPRIEPFREVVLRGVVFERVVGDRGDHLLHLREVFRAADLGARLGILEDEVPEGELLGDVVAQLREQRLGVLGDESRPELPGLLLEGGLRRLQQHGHQGVVLADAAAEVDPGVVFLALRRVAAVQDESYVGDHAQEVLLVAFVELHGLLVAAGQEDLRTRALAQNLLLLVEGILEELGVLQQDQLVELREVGRVEADGVLDQEDRLHAPLEDILVGVHLVLDELDDADDEFRVPVPREDVVEPRVILLLDAAVDVLREGGEQRHGNVRVPLLDDLREGEDVGLPDVVHREDEVVGVVAGQGVERLGGRAHARERRRVRHVQVDVLLVDLRFDMSVLLEDVSVVAAAHKQDLVDAVFHEAVGYLCLVGEVLFEVAVHGWRRNFGPRTKIPKK